MSEEINVSVQEAIHILESRIQYQEDLIRDLLKRVNSLEKVQYRLKQTTYYSGPFED